MDGYLHGRSTPHRWHTGDLGSIDADGYLTVHGRRDNLIVTPAGRNISPEWIETILLGDLRIGAAVLGQTDDATLALLLIPSRAGERWFEDASQVDLHTLVSRSCAAAPDYALPETVSVCSREEAGRTKLFTPNGRIRRAAALALLAEKARPFQSYATMR
jgi:acyl-CoA synthetase (AMP-forming)/AMP-acid ligase II